MFSSAQSNTNTPSEQRIHALAAHLGISTDEISPCNYEAHRFEVGSDSYLVLTDEEAKDLCAERIKDSLWAFNAEFIAAHATNAWSDRCVKALKEMQGELREDANPIVEALIEDLDDFISDAISADGRGHFLSGYDGDEREQGNFFIYRD